MSQSDIKTRYAGRYAAQPARHKYPVEFVVRAFLGTYPELKLDLSEFTGTNVLDLGFGDGRNMPLLSNLGLRIHGVEIHSDIIDSTHAALEELGIQADLRVGSNRNIPYPDAYFGIVLACHACYYVEEGTTFADNLSEIHRVLQPNGLFIASLPMRSTYILQDADALGDGHFRIRTDPFGLRAGTIFRAFETDDEVRGALGSHFNDLRVGYCDDLYWGIHQKVWIVVCRRD